MGCEDNEKPMKNSLTIEPIIQKVDVEYCTLNQSNINWIEQERIWIRHYAEYYLSATSTIVLKSLDFNWEVIDYETEPQNELYWEYGTDYGGYWDISDNAVVYGTELYFRLPPSFVGGLSVGGHSAPDTEQDSLDRGRIHDILDFYSTDLPFTITVVGYYLLSETDTSHFNVVYSDTFYTEIDTTECN